MGFLSKSSKTGPLKRKYRSSDELRSEYNELVSAGKRFILCVTVGRSGTRWLSDIFDAHDNAVGSTERNVLAESFYRYVVCNDLPVDVQGIMDMTKADIIDDWKKSDISMLVSPYFSHDIMKLSDELKIDRIIWGVNDAKFTVTSFYNKGWYKDSIIRKDDELVYGFQPVHDDMWSHFYGRLIPKGDLFREWKGLTRIGKISWFYNKVNMEIYEQVKDLPEEKLLIFKLKDADQNYEYYLNIARQFSLDPVLSKSAFLSIKKKTFRKSHNIQKQWSGKETQEFQKYTSEFTSIYKNLA
ncbi:hypothetical protein ACFLTD_00175 [Elusimicrobiota bacterium]